MEEYAKAKLTLFTAHQCEHAIINVDDVVGATWAKQLPNALAVSLKPTTDFAHTVFANHIAYAESGITIEFSGKFGEGTLHAR